MTDGWWARRRARTARRSAVALAGASPETAPSELAAAVGIASRARVTGPRPAWARLEDLETEVDRLVGEWLA